MSARSVFFLLHGPNSRGKLAGVIYGYFDESQAGKQIENYPRTFCGLIAQEENWKAFDEQWNRVLDDPKWPNRVERFHSSPCVAGEGEFLGWSDSARIALIGELTDVAIGCDLIAAGVSMLPRAFEDLPLPFQQMFTSPKSLMMEHAIQTLLKQASDHWPGEDVGLVVDSLDKETSKEAFNLRQRYLNHSKWGTLTSFADASSYKLTMLQGADLIAFGAFRFHMERGPFSDNKFNIELAPHMDRIVRKMETTGVTWTSSDLMRIATKAVTNG